jgi:hypothetical protein
MLAARAHARLQALAPAVTEITLTPPPSLRQLQHALSTKTNEAHALRATALCHSIEEPDHPRHTALYHKPFLIKFGMFTQVQNENAFLVSTHFKNRK